MEGYGNALWSECFVVPYNRNFSLFRFFRFYCPKSSLFSLVRVSACKLLVPNKKTTPDDGTAHSKKATPNFTTTGSFYCVLLVRFVCETILIFAPMVAQLRNCAILVLRAGYRWSFSEFWLGEPIKNDTQFCCQARIFQNAMVWNIVSIWTTTGLRI